MKSFKTGLLIILLCFLGISTQAQWTKVTYKDIGYEQIGFNLGLTNYFGDLNPLPQYVSTDISKTRPTFGIQYIRKLSPRIQGRLGLSWVRIIGDDFDAADPGDTENGALYRYIRNAHFRNDMIEASLVFTYDLIPSRWVYYKRAKITPYLLLGIAGIYHNPRARTPEAFGNKWVNLRPLRTEGQGLTRSDGSSYEKQYSLFQPTIPFGLGVRWKLTDRLDFAVELTLRYTFTDYLDDVGGNYANPDDLESDLARAMADRTLEPTAARRGGDRVEEVIRLKERLGQPADIFTPFAGFGADGDKRGEAGNNDLYATFGFQLNYILNVGLNCAGGRGRGAK